MLDNAELKGNPNSQRVIQIVKGSVAGDSITLGELESRTLLRLYSYLLGLD
jgi:hypothetical protein